MSTPIEPSISETAFSCPHCGAYTSQNWYNLRASSISGNNPIPLMPGPNSKSKFENDHKLSEEEKAEILQFIDKCSSGLVFIDDHKSSVTSAIALNLNLSECYNCRKIAVWVHKNLVFPSKKTGVMPNADLPADVVKDFEEARSIVNESPRGAAALLRLCIQKLCAHLGEKGKNIDADIASLVKKGLNPVVQQSLDIVRVIGNESVHPGTVDLNDDRDTALHLFHLVNAIADQMISHPKKVQEMYAKLPSAKREAIEKRDAKGSTSIN